MFKDPNNGASGQIESERYLRPKARICRSSNSWGWMLRPRLESLDIFNQI